MQIYVDCNNKLRGDGTSANPYRTINAAARVAVAGDEIIVMPGIYRENVNPVNGGKADKRIVYRSSEPRKAVITGADLVKGWKQYEDTSVYYITLPAGYFGDFNPYNVKIWGDWFWEKYPATTGEVYLNDKSMYEVTSIEDCINPPYNDESWDRDFTKYVWYSHIDDETEETTIYANFQGCNPNEECVEINARKACFYPQAEHVDYITLSGFVVTKAATQWAPPTALQEGMIGPHWSKGWIIENCEVSHSKCSGISLGKYKQENNDNRWSKEKYKDGSQTQRDCSLIALMEGWSKETIGSHIIRDCDIHDCGQTGIVGNLGCVFSVIENNHIHHINNKRNLAGAEIGGIKLHAAIDVIINNNHFHHCTRGIWLDWQAQGTRVTGNLFHDNCMTYDYLIKKENLDGLGLGEDLFIEIAHGPTLVDNNIFLSERAIKLPTQGVAFVHNFFGGAITAVGRGVKNGAKHFDSTRYTPYHAPHSTAILGFMSVLHGDVRFYNNVFVNRPVRPAMEELCKVFAEDEWDDGNLVIGTSTFDSFETEEQWKQDFEGYCGEGADSRDKYYKPLPVWFGDNVYFNGAKPCVLEENPTVDNEHKVDVSLVMTEEGKWEFISNYNEYLQPTKGSLLSSCDLGLAFEPEQRFEGPDGETIVFDTDIFGAKRTGSVYAGPINF